MSPRPSDTDPNTARGTSRASTREVRRVNGLEQLLPFVLIFLAFWLLLIRPQRKRQQALQQAQGEVVVGDQVLLGAGIVGHVTEAGPEFLQLEISPGAHMKVARQSVARKLSEPVETSYDATYDDEDDEDTTYDDTSYEGDEPGSSDSDPHRPTTS
jgi:preprotein translocase subunit YajC